MQRFSEGRQLPSGYALVALVLVGTVVLSATSGGVPSAAPLAGTGASAAAPGAAVPSASGTSPSVSGGLRSSVVAASGASGFGFLGTVPVAQPSGSVVTDTATGDVYFGGSPNMTVVQNSTVVASIPVGNYSELGAYDPADGFVYFVLPSAQEVVVLNGTSIVGFVPTPGPYPHGIVYDPADREMYVANGTCVTVLNNTTVIASVQVVGNGRSAWDLAYDAANGDVYVLVGPGTITILNGTNNVSFSPLVPAQSYPFSLTYDPVNGLVYVPLGYNGSVAVFNGTSYSGNVPASGAPFDVVVDASNGLAYTLSYPGSNSNALTVLNGSTVVGNVWVPAPPTGAAFDPAIGDLLVAGGNFSTNGSSVAVAIRGTNVQFEIPIGSGTVGVGVDPLTGYAYLPSYTGNASVLGPGSFYSITFNESGLEAGWAWGISIDGVPLWTTAPSLEISLANGSYPYAIDRPFPPPNLGGNNSSGNGSGPSRFNWTESPLPYNGSLVVAGSNVSEPTLMYTITAPDVEVVFQEFGLPTNVTWSVTLNGTVRQVSNGSWRQIGFPVAPGTYPYALGEVAGYAQTDLPAAGNLTVTTAYALQFATFFEGTVFYAPVTYRVDLSESGLPVGAVFNISLAGTDRQLVADGGTDNLSWTGLPNGSYPYAISDVAGWHESDLRYQGMLTVDGGSQPIDGSGVGYAIVLDFAQVVYNVTFTEVGLPTGTVWNVTVGSTEYSTATSSLVVPLPNGTYSYALGGLGGWREAPLPYTGALSVGGFSEYEPTFAFSQVTYGLTFVETGLPAGTVWTVVVGTTILYSAGDTMTFEVPNGSFHFSVLPVAGYHGNLTSGTAGVDGSVVSIALTFSANPSPLVPSWVVPAGAGAAAGALVAGALGLAALSRARRANRSSPPAAPWEEGPGRKPS